MAERLQWTCSGGADDVLRWRLVRPASHPLQQLAQANLRGGIEELLRRRGVQVPVGDPLLSEQTVSRQGRPTSGRREAACSPLAATYVPTSAERLALDSVGLSQGDAACRPHRTRRQDRGSAHHLSTLDWVVGRSLWFGKASRLRVEPEDQCACKIHS